MPGENKDLLSQLAYRTFCGACGGRNLLPWDELPPLIHDAWRLTVATIVDRVLQFGDPKETEETHVE